MNPRIRRLTHTALVPGLALILSAPLFLSLNAFQEQYLIMGFPILCCGFVSWLFGADLLHRTSLHTLGQPITRRRYWNEHSAYALAFLIPACFMVEIFSRVNSFELDTDLLNFLVPWGSAAFALAVSPYVTWRMRSLLAGFLFPWLTLIALGVCFEALMQPSFDAYSKEPFQGMAWDHFYRARIANIMILEGSGFIILCFVFAMVNCR